MDVNLKSVYLVTKETVPLCMKEGGAIVNPFVGKARDGGGFGALAYAAAKGGVLTPAKRFLQKILVQKAAVNCVLS
jgi:3-oxoacyl-[acyl-carrier protein] reductase